MSQFYTMSQKSTGVQNITFSTELVSLDELHKETSFLLLPVLMFVTNIANYLTINSWKIIGVKLTSIIFYTSQMLLLITT